MKIMSSISVLVLSLFAAVSVGAQSHAEMIAKAVQPLPDDLQDAAGVYTYDDSGQRQTLRQGSNNVECRTTDENGFNWCYPVTSTDRRDYQAKLDKGMSREEVRAAMAAAEEAGAVEPWPFGSLIYRTYGNDDRIQLLWVVLVPNAMAEDLGMSLASQRDSSLAGQGLPWMMREGTPGAHLMIPINSRELSNQGGAKMRKDTKAMDDMVAHATLPLPEDLRAGAAVVTYDPDTGARKVLREGSNMIECQARDERTGFTRCYHKGLAAESNLRAKLSAEGKDFQAVSAGVNAARADGTIPVARMGSIAYRLYEEDDRMILLWVLRLPNATSAELGMPTASQRDNSLAGKGLPWMMREGTPSAHLMIPINGTELSNDD